jgi:hypothetical protein
MSKRRFIWRDRQLDNLFGEVIPNEIVRIFRDDQLTWIDDIPLVNAYFINS